MNKEQNKPNKPNKPICKEQADGTKEWWLNGKLHREDGPAFEDADGYKAWWLNGELHREDGPAIERADGSKVWYLNGEHHQEKDYWKALHRRGLIDDTELFEKLL